MADHPRRDLLDRAQPQDREKSPDLEHQQQAGVRPRTPESAARAQVDASGTEAGSATERISDVRRQGLNPERDRTPFRPRDEGGPAPTA